MRQTQGGHIGSVMGDVLVPIGSRTLARPVLSLTSILPSVYLLVVYSQDAVQLVLKPSSKLGADMVSPIDVPCAIYECDLYRGRQRQKSIVYKSTSPSTLTSTTSLPRHSCKSSAVSCERKGGTTTRLVERRSGTRFMMPWCCNSTLCTAGVREICAPGRACAPHWV